MAAPIEFSGQTDLSSSSSSGLDDYMQYIKQDRINLGGVGKKTIILGNDNSWLKWAAAAVALLVLVKVWRG